MTMHSLKPRTGVAMAAAIVLAGCASEPAPTDYSLADDPAVQVLQDAVQTIEHQNEILVQVERGERATKRPTPRPDDVEALSESVEMRNWSGPALEAVRTVGSAIAYDVRISGSRPAVTPLVSVDSRGKDAWDVLYDIADQTDRALDLRIDPDRERITVAYRDRTASS